MKPIYFMAIISFVSGFLGYIILQLWIRPILGYKKIKNLSFLKVIMEICRFGIKYF